MNDKTVLFSVYPNKRGFGFACVDCPNTLIDYGVVTTRPISNGKLFKQVVQFLEFHKPHLIILRDCKTLSSAKRSQKLIEEISAYAQKMKISVHYYSRQQIRDVFEQYGATTKYEIAKKLVECFPELAGFMPKMRKPWADESYHMRIFDALALAATHKYFA